MVYFVVHLFENSICEKLSLGGIIHCSKHYTAENAVFNSQKTGCAMNFSKNFPQHHVPGMGSARAVVKLMFRITRSQKFSNLAFAINTLESVHFCIS